MSEVAAPRLCKKSEVCARIGISPRCLENMIIAGAFPPPVRLGKYVLWSDKAVDFWIQDRFREQEAWRP
jgi:predicted DNA-binding transcriptional regulator AlpA